MKCFEHLNSCPIRSPISGPRLGFLLIFAFAVTNIIPAKAQIAAFVDRPRLGDNFVTLLECSSVVNYGISTTIVTNAGEKFQIPSQFVIGQIALPKPTDSKFNIEKVVSQLKPWIGRYPQADLSINQLVSRLEQQAMNADTPPPAPATIGTGLELSEKSGKSYKNVTIRKVDPDGLLIAHSGGVRKVPFSDLSEEIQTKYGYNPARAEAFLKEQAALRRAREEQERVAREMAAVRESAIRIHFRITQVVDDGLIIWNLIEQNTEFLRVNPSIFDVADGEEYMPSLFQTELMTTLRF
jgi:hypothetical protein